MNQEFATYINQLESKEALLTDYNCPTCSGQIETLVPPPGEIYDSVMICPHCEVMHFKVVHPDGTVKHTIEEVIHERRS